MTKHEKDISQLKKYLEGKLDARSMYELERRAQDDPFLQDALEGYENAGKPQDDNLKDLSQRLKSRTEKKESRVIAMRFIAIAASVLLVLFAGLLWFIMQRPSHQPQIAKMQVSPAKKTADTVLTVPKKNTEVATLIQAAPKSAEHHKNAAIAKQSIIGNAYADANVTEPVASGDKIAEQNTPSAETFKSNAKDSTPLNEAVVMDYSAQQLTGKVAGVIATPGKSITGLVRDATGPLGGVALSINGTSISTLTNNQGYFVLQQVPYKSTLDITYPGYNAKHIMIKKQDSLIIAMQPTNNNALADVVTTAYGVQKKTAFTGTSSTAKTYMGGNQIKGLVKDESGQPLPGAIVRIKGTSTATVTDMNGRFAVPLSANGSTLQIAFIGYESKEIIAKKTDSLVIALRPTGNSLSEVVVNDYGGEPQRSPAQPVGGWDDFNKYLKESAISPDGKTGTVKVSFTVNPDNSLSGFKVLKGISAKTDTAAVELIRNGPEWLRNSNNKAEKVKVRIKFEVKK